ncbi:MAG: MCE family protein [Mycobacteriaceae bacterium]|nr:MCE family protein [Mycobacteriaceae bacterium]
MNSIPLWRWLARRRVAVANLGLVIVLVLGVGYLAGAILRVDPFRATITVKVAMPNSGGLQANNDVTFRGLRVGRVRSVEIAATGVVAVAEIDASAKIPAGGAAAVARLSAAGEQYLDLRPDSESAPYLRDGAVIGGTRVQVPVPIGSVLVNVSAMINGLNPDRLSSIVAELDKALAGGPDRLRSVVSGLSQAAAGMEGLLPQTSKLVETLSVIADTTAHAQPDLGALTRSSGTVFRQFSDADAEVRRLLDLSPGQLATLSGVVTANVDPMTGLVTNLVAITRAARLRTPAMTALFPALRSFSEAIGIPAWDSEFHTLADFYPRPSCDYRSIPVNPDVSLDGRTPLYNYCLTNNPALQMRGSANAPRPPGLDNTAGPPPGVRGDERSRPLSGK